MNLIYQRYERIELFLAIIILNQQICFFKQNQSTPYFLSVSARLNLKISEGVCNLGAPTFAQVTPDPRQLYQLLTLYCV